MARSQDGRRTLGLAPRGEPPHVAALLMTYGISRDGRRVRVLGGRRQPVLDTDVKLAVVSVRMDEISRRGDAAFWGGRSGVRPGLSRDPVRSLLAGVAMLG